MGDDDRACLHDALVRICDVRGARRRRWWLELVEHPKRAARRRGSEPARAARSRFMSGGESHTYTVTGMT
ncbi:MAG: hypothetical protein WAU42_11680, partial [Solirubrobacteraceae bacterium]